MHHTKSCVRQYERTLKTHQSEMTEHHCLTTAYEMKGKQISLTSTHVTEELCLKFKETSLIWFSLAN